MQNFISAALLFLLVQAAMVQADKRVTCFRLDADMGGKPFPKALEDCMRHTEEHHEAEIETHKCLWGKLGVTPDNMKEKLCSIATEEFKKQMGEIADRCKKPTMDEVCQCLDDELSPVCNDDDPFITTTAASA